MIDFHTHVLPGLDDGAKDTLESANILRELQSQGVDTVVLTPHFYYEEQTVENFLKKRSISFASVQKDIPNGQKVVLGAELFFSQKKVDYSQLARLAIEGTSYILVELPFSDNWDKKLFSALEDFIYTTRLTPIIAHAERYLSVRKRPQYVFELIKLGCLIQLNANSLFQKNTKQLALKLLKNNQIHCFGSDAHNLRSRRPMYKEAANFISQNMGLDVFEKLQNNMKDILSDKDVQIELTKPVKKFLGFYY